MSASLASARMKSRARDGSRWMLASLVSSDFISSLHRAQSPRPGRGLSRARVALRELDVHVRSIKRPRAALNPRDLARPKLGFESLQNAVPTEHRRNAQTDVANVVF